MSIPPEQQQQKGKRDTVVEVLATMSSRKLWKGGKLKSATFADWSLPQRAGRGCDGTYVHAVARAGEGPASRGAGRNPIPSGGGPALRSALAHMMVDARGVGQLSWRPPARAHAAAAPVAAARPPARAKAPSWALLGNCKPWSSNACDCRTNCYARPCQHVCWAATSSTHRCG